MSMQAKSVPRYFGTRFCMLIFAVLLAAQCAWLLVANLARPHIDRLPTDPNSAAAAAQQREAATWAATVGGIRGDLWANSAFTYASLLWSKPGQIAAAEQQQLSEAAAQLGRALGNAPYNSGAWLLFAGLALRYPSVNLNSDAALKMSYYTGPSEQYLIPLRLQIAARSDFVRDVELREFVSRDLNFLLSRQEDSAVVAAYNAASSVGRTFIERAVGNTNPSVLKLLHAAGQPF